ncbi:class A beta-lactamase-related serine hydrolase [Oceanobacillus piezotolerans]|uniref:Class A beta-lactamase-related serine hydrolase n=1 Tax=Oceanobacillus piezotolerans TaxID=2448030 RepID=A0A498DDJ6_9BACI|nr:serine hydrolase domain-containing protein [Oceanobacillus piezotolerans]RLL48282.1 class A beta-lactamase-related serine hydrolase [Oceanobacillus piezotolerans]
MKLNNINIKQRMEHYNAVGLSVALIEKSQISNKLNYGLLEAGQNTKVNNHSIFSACSISKFLTAMLVLKFAELGLIDLDEDVNKRLKSWKVPENKLTKNKKVTLRNLLSHQSGIIDPKDSFTDLNPVIGYPSIIDLLEGKTPYCQTPIEVKYEPESDFYYSDAGFCIIQQLIEDVTEKPFNQVVRELIFVPLEMENSTYTTAITESERVYFSCGHNKDGNLVEGKYPIYPYPAASGLWTTASDLSKLVIELMNALKGESKIGISVNRAKDIISPQGDKEWSGLGVFLDSSDEKMEISSLGWGIGFQCMLVAYPYLESGLVIMTNTDLGVHQLKGIIGEIYQSLSF